MPDFATAIGRTQKHEVIQRYFQAISSSSEAPEEPESQQDLSDEIEEVVVVDQLEGV